MLKSIAVILAALALQACAVNVVVAPHATLLIDSDKVEAK